jgi:predicted nucleotidyltransferase
MEDIKERLGEYKYNYFSDLQKYLDTELYFYGSIKRVDYFSNASDIDITIITDNINSVLSKIQNYLHIKKSNIKKIYQKFNTNSKSIVKGYKIKYQNKDRNLNFDLLIYDEKYRKIVIENINEINNLPAYLVIILVIIKTIYYNLGLMSKEMYLYLKNALFYMYFSKSFGIYDKKNMSTIILDI